MKEGGPLYDKVVDCNWVPKRKRKLKSVAFDATAEKEDLISSEITKESTSLRKVIKGEHSSQCSQRVMGQDGYYFECEHCDLGGNLLCCDNCPRTYHLECLNPPLKRAPAGKWVCPKCCNQEVGKPSSNLETSSLRVRSKTAKKALAAYSTFSSDKTSHLERDLLESSKSFGKGKAASLHRAASDKIKSNSLLAGISANISPSFSDDSILEDGASAIGVLKMKKKAVSSSQRKLNAEKMVNLNGERSLVKSLNLHISDKVTKKKRNFCRNEKQGKKFVIPVAVSSHILKKAKKKINKIDKVSSKSLNGERSPKISDHSCGEASPCHVSVSYSKLKSGERLSSNASLKEGTILLKSSRLKKPEISPHGASFLSHGLNELGENLEKTITCQGFFHDAQQVDRILGCRIKTGSSGISQPTSIIASQEKLNAEREVLQTMFPSVDFTSQESHDQVDCFDKSDAVEVKFENAMDMGFQCEANLTALKIAQNSIELENGVKGKICEICNNTHKDDALSLTSQPFLENCMACKGFELDDSSTGDINVGDSFTEKCLECHDATTELKCCRSSVDISVPKRSVQESRLQDTELVAYEYFVKWAGKSNIHNSWVSEDQLKILAKRKLENYKAKYGVAIINICEEQWCQPQRIISFIESDNGEEALVKWCGLSYDECTWEKLDEPAILIASHLFSEFKQIESQTLNKDAIADFMRTDFHDVVPLIEQPKELKGGSLFPHQLEALNWLRKCWKKSKNVILADEMGLGKTVSACSFISSLYFEFKVKLPCLVLVPLSTMPNWLAEFASWTHLNVVEYHGSAKARSVIRQYEWHASDANRPDKLSKAYKFNVLLTTYEMILADSSHLRGVPWEVLVVDEGHRLKNSESKLFSLLNTFSFQHRVLLTGTPLQNNLGEMYNLLNFLQPCSFPSLSSFEEKFNDLSTAEKVEELKKLVAPHMLRRLKRDAMQNIPPKTERIVPVELTSIQAEYYRAMLTKNYQILRNIGKGVAQQSMLNIVMQLRKVCNHPYLIPGTEPESGSLEFLQEMRIKASAKLSLLHSMLKILHKEGHRVLIFSQMTKLLDILEDYLTVEFGPGTYERVDGSVSVANRQAAIVRFNQNKTRFVFLLSTRSCGLGINLATADTVIIYDSDFNPHADIQAMNRAHRIGQSNRLLVYRLVVRASVEERILQLAKKKLMLDQLFVNKSGSQKEVEDILRWGTEELFSDSDDAKNDYINNVDTTTDGENKHRRRSGCLGDVYRDKCTNVGKFSWDENAILKLLDRSNLQSCISENGDVDLENDLLGSVKSLDWNDEPINEESGGSELLTNISADCCEPPLDAKDDNTNTFQGENEWDRLLRVRWEKCQLEEGEVLGRGKRLRKAISYKEAFVSMQNEALSESASDDEVKQEYTPAGQALKEKFAKLRARQKERIARQRSMQSLLPHIEGSTNGEPRYEDIDACELDLLAKPQEAESSQKFDSMRISNSMVKNGWSTNNGLKMDHISCLDLSVNTTGNLSTEISQNNHMKQTGLATLISSSNHLPVLGLCAPNAMKTHSTSRTFKARVSKHAFQNERSKSAVGFPNFPSVSADVSAGLFVGSSSRDALADPLTLTDTPMAALNHRLKDIISDRHLPFFSPPHPTIGRGLSELGESSGTSYPQFYEKFGLPRFDHDGAYLPKFASPPKSSRKRQKDFFTNLPLGTKIDPDLSKVHSSVNFRRDLNEFLKQKQQLFEFPPALGLSTSLTLPALPDNHKKVLDNIMMRTQTAVHKFWKKKLKTNAWSEDELDTLWIGVRRHGSGNWDAILRNPKLKILKHRSTEELSSRWNEEQHKIFDGPTSFPNLTSAFSDGLRTQALHNSKFSAFGQELSKSHSHLRDIKLAYGDLMPKFPCFEQSSHAGTASESLPSLPFGPSDKFGSSRGFSASMLIRPPEKIVLPSQDQFATHNSFSGTLFGPPGMNSGSNHTLPLNEDLPAAVETLDFPIPPDKSPNFLCGTQNIDSGVSETEMSFYGKKKRGFSKFSMDEDSDLGSSSNANKLPHWLREAVSAPTSRSEPVLPPSVSAITHSVRLLYGKENSSIPPFLMPEHPPLKPEDPRKTLRKRRKFDRHQRAAPNASNSVFVSASSSAPPFLPLLPSMLPTSVPPLPPMQASSVSTPLLPSFICPVPLSVPTPTPYSFLPEPLKEVPLPSLFRKEAVPTLQSLNLESLSSQSFSAPLPLTPSTAQKMPKYSEFSASKDNDLGEGFECLPMKHQWADSSTNVSCEDKQIFEQVGLTKSGDLDNVKSDSFNTTDGAIKMLDVLPMEDFSGSKCEQES